MRNNVLRAIDNNNATTVSHKITINTGAHENRRLVHQWLANCMTNHEKCNHPRRVMTGCQHACWILDRSH